MRHAERVHVGVIGASRADEETCRQAELVGRLIARRGAVLVSGGMTGVMAAASHGARAEGGFVIGIVPGADRREANPDCDVVIATGFGEARNLVIIRTSDVLVAVAGSHGTLSEIGFALRMGKRVVGLRTWQVDGVEPADSPEAAVALAVEGRFR